MGVDTGCMFGFAGWVIPLLGPWDIVLSLSYITFQTFFIRLRLLIVRLSGLVNPIGP
jgi:hypothetical protein